MTTQAQCFSRPSDVGDALRAGNHGDPYAALITADFDWSRDDGLPRPPGEHYHVMRGTDPRVLVAIPGIEPWQSLVLSESTPAATTLPFVHFYVVIASSPCEDLSTY